MPALLSEMLLAKLSSAKPLGTLGLSFARVLSFQEAVSWRIENTGSQVARLGLPLRIRHFLRLSELTSPSGGGCRNDKDCV